MHDMSLQGVMLLTLQSGTELLGTKSGYIKDNRVMKTVSLIPLSGGSNRRRKVCP